MKYLVRYEVEGFVEKQEFKNKKEAKKYYNFVINKLENYLLDIKLYKI